MRIKLLWAWAILVVGLALLPSEASAQMFGNLKLHIIQTGSAETVIWNLLQKILYVLGIVAFFYLIWAGFNYMTAGGDEGKVKIARQTIINVVFGIILIAISQALVLFVISQTKEADTSNQTKTQTAPKLRQPAAVPPAAP